MVLVCLIRKRRTADVGLYLLGVGRLDFREVAGEQEDADVIRRLLFYVLVLLTLGSILYGFRTGSLWSLLAAIITGFSADLVKAGRKLGAPFAKKRGYVGFNGHRRPVLYRQTLDRLMDQIGLYQESSRSDGPGSESYRKYERAKWNYALVFHRYEQARKEEGWVY